MQSIISYINIENAGVVNINIFIKLSVQHTNISTKAELDKSFFSANIFSSAFMKIL